MKLSYKLMSTLNSLIFFKIPHPLVILLDFEIIILWEAQFHVTKRKKK